MPAIDEQHVSLSRQLACARRELGMRIRVYPGLVMRGAMTQAEVTDELAAQIAIVRTLERLVEEQAPPAQGELLR